MSLPPYILDNSLSNKKDATRKFLLRDYSASPENTTDPVNTNALVKSPIPPSTTQFAATNILPKSPILPSTTQNITTDTLPKNSLADFYTNNATFNSFQYIMEKKKGIPLVNNYIKPIEIQYTGIISGGSGSPGTEVIYVNEGDTLVFGIRTSELTDLTTYYWFTSGDGIYSTRFVDNTLSGAVNITNHDGIISRQITWDEETGGPGDNKEFVIYFKRTPDYNLDDIISFTPPFYINDTSLDPSYSVTESTTDIYEGGPGTAITLHTTGLLDGTTVYWTTSGVTDPTRFVDNRVSGFITIVNNVGTLSRAAAPNSISGDTRNFNILFYRHQGDAQPKAVSDVITLHDTTPTIAANTSNIYEGASTGVTFTLTIPAIPDGTVVYWNTYSPNTNSYLVSAADFVDNTMTGTATFYNSTATITRIAAANTRYFDTRNFFLQFFKTSPSGPYIITSPTITIKDTTAPIYSITPANPSAYLSEGSPNTTTYNVGTSGVTNGTVIYWTMSGNNIQQSDFTDSITSGTFTITGATSANNYSYSTVITKGAAFTGLPSTNKNSIPTDSAGVTSIPNKAFQIQLHLNSTTGPVTASFADTPTQIYKTPYSFNFIPYDSGTSSILVSEGGNMSFTFSVPETLTPGNIMYYKITDAQSSDFVDGQTTGFFNVPAGQSTVTITKNAAITLTGPSLRSIGNLELHVGGLNGVCFLSAGPVNIRKFTPVVVGTTTGIGTWGLIFDSYNNLYVADSHQKIEKVNPNDFSAVRYAGTGVTGFSGDGGPALNARLNAPQDFAIDSNQNLYFSDANNSRIRKIDTDGIITTFAGITPGGYNGDNISATTAALSGPRGMAFDTSGNLYFADVFNQRIRKIDTNGIITTVVGNGTKGSSGDGGNAIYATLNNPGDIKFDGTGNMFIADTGNNKIRKVDKNTNTITTVVGNGTQGIVDNSPATSTGLNYPINIAFDSSYTNLYISNYLANVVYAVNQNTQTGRILAGYLGGGQWRVTTLNHPVGIAVGGNNQNIIYIGDSFNERIIGVQIY